MTLNGQHQNKGTGLVNTAKVHANLTEINIMALTETINKNQLPKVASYVEHKRVKVGEFSENLKYLEIGLKFTYRLS